MHAQQLVDLYFALAKKEGNGPALAIIGARYGDEVAESLRQSLEDAGEFGPPKTFNDGLEQAALWHERQAESWEQHVLQGIVPSGESLASHHRDDAAAIRAMKES